jgi:hypothetical protein
MTFAALIPTPIAMRADDRRSAAGVVVGDAIGVAEVDSR